MTRGKILFMTAGAIVVALLLWLAVSLEPDSGRNAAVQKALQQERAATQTTVDAGDFFVTGHVHHAGMYTLRSDATLRAALTAAGGATGADPTELVVELTRKTSGKAGTQTIALSQVLSGENNPTLQLGDIIDVVHQAKPATIPIMPLPAVK